MLYGLFLSGVELFETPKEVPWNLKLEGFGQLNEACALNFLVSRNTQREKHYTKKHTQREVNSGQ